MSQSQSQGSQTPQCLCALVPFTLVLGIRYPRVANAFSLPLPWPLIPTRPFRPRLKRAVGVEKVYVGNNEVSENSSACAWEKRVTRVPHLAFTGNAHIVTLDEYAPNHV